MRPLFDSNWVFMSSQHKSKRIAGGHICPRLEQLAFYRRLWAPLFRFFKRFLQLIWREKLRSAICDRVGQAVTPPNCTLGASHSAMKTKPRPGHSTLGSRTPVYWTTPLSSPAAGQVSGPNFYSLLQQGRYLDQTSLLSCSRAVIWTKPLFSPAAGQVSGPNLSSLLHQGRYLDQTSLLSCSRAGIWSKPTRG